MHLASPAAAAGGLGSQECEELKNTMLRAEQEPAGVRLQSKEQHAAGPRKRNRRPRYEREQLHEETE
jgi:hypothetical protein